MNHLYVKVLSASEKVPLADTSRAVHLELRILGVFRGRREISPLHQRVPAEVHGDDVLLGNCRRSSVADLRTDLCYGVEFASVNVTCAE
jgi:hypothetical protein